MAIDYVRLDSAGIRKHIDDLTDVLVDAVNGGASVSYLAPITIDDGKAYWEKLMSAIDAGGMILLVAMEDNHVIGTVQLDLAWQPNAPHRAEVQKLLVHSAYRRRGIASQLMQAVEIEANAKQRWLLFLDTERGSGAQTFYETIGYVEGGIIPQYSLNSAGEFADTVIFYKLLK